jgi:hypothetical protein
MADTPLLEAALAYRAARLSIIPCQLEDKKPFIPIWKPYQSRLASEIDLRIWFARAPALAVVTGAGSGGLEILDFDNKGAPDAITLYTNWCTLVDSLISGLTQVLPIERSQHGGYHIFYRCSAVGRSQKLARRAPTAAELAAESQMRSITLIETRGEGGYCVIAPTPGYQLLRGDWTHIPIITPEARAHMIDSARALNQQVDAVIGQQQPTARAAFSRPRPGDAFNAHGDPLPYLEQAGWHVTHKHDKTLYLCRPGKPSGVSATLSYVAPNVLYMFSSNAAPFEPERGYSPFAVYALLEHNGNFSAATQALAGMGYIGLCHPNGAVQ